MTAQCHNDGCASPPFCRGLCRRCYVRERGARLGACTMPDCATPQHARGLCMTHYFREWRSKPHM